MSNDRQLAAWLAVCLAVTVLLLVLWACGVGRPGPAPTPTRSWPEPTPHCADPGRHEYCGPALTPTHR